MGILNEFFGISSNRGTSPAEDTDTDTLTRCETCEIVVDDEDDLQDGECEECFDSEYAGPKYCCGGIYEEGQDTCASCGEPL